MPPSNLSPSLVARYFHHQCPRFLRYAATPPQARAGLGIPEPMEEQSVVTDLLRKKGFAWEEEAVGGQIPGKVLVAPGAGPLHERRFGVQESLRLLADAPAGTGIYQSTLVAPPGFYRRFSLDPTVCSFHESHPDLIWSIGDERLRVIDLKATDQVKTSHRVQVALYALIIDAILEEQGIERSVDRTCAGVWLQDAEAPETVEITPDLRVLETFLSHDLGAIMGAPPHDLPWHLRPNCEACPFFASCQREADEKNSVSLMPGLTPGARRYLHDLGVDGLEDLEKFLTEPDADDTLERCGSLRGKGERLKRQVSALTSGTVVPLGGASPSLPINESIGVIVTLQKEPVGGRLYAAGFRRFKGKDVYPSPSQVWVQVARTPEECGEVGKEFVRALHHELKTLAEYNEGRSFREQRSLQTYVLDEGERLLLLDLLRECAEDPETATEALPLLQYYAGVNGDRTRYPVVVLSRLLNESVALPVPVAARLPDVLAALLGADHPASFSPSDLFWPALSNRMKSDAVAMAWYGGRAEALEWTRDEVARRLRTSGDLLCAIRDRSHPHRWAEKFAFPPVHRYAHPELAALAGTVREEAATAAAEVRQARCLPEAEAEWNGTQIRLRCIDSENWEVLSRLDRATLPTIGGLPGYLLVPDTAEGMRAARAFDDAPYVATTRPPQGEVRFAGVKEVEENRSGQVSRLTLAIRYAADQDQFGDGDHALLFPRATDFTSTKILDQIEESDALRESDLLTLLTDPRAFAMPMPFLCHPDPEALAGFTESQRRALSRILENRLTLVWGPPGTGKTHFLAHTIRTIAKAGQGRIRIAVSALTHAAIENLLFELQNLTSGDFGLDLSVCKLERATSPKGHALTVLGHDVIKAMTRVPDRFVLGGTAQAFHKYRTHLPTFDLLIIDEASQMQFGELALLLPLLDTGGRLVLAGDDLQLPPVVMSGTDEDEEENELQDSVFAWMRRRDTGCDTSCTVQLLENWRMNATLSRFSAESLYGSGYRPANEDVACQQIRLLEGDHRDPFVEYVLDPACPLTVVVLEGVRAAVENREEAGLVADLACALRERLCQPEQETPYPASMSGDSAFWREGLFIVSPHHAQIAAIKHALSERRPWKSDPFVDTVDKMQGQQCEAVIVSYGVSDSETALREAEFIYSLNRLNVSVTRARAKCIVFLPRPLLEPSFELLRHEKAARGLEYMLTLLSFCENGEKQKFSLEGVGDVTVFRTT
ncbi:ATP-dependent helicase [Methanofollis aquaemaris]|uniref:ATP-dependent helicase n=1 Tax=Methanofollis aquaemaris TaxID=126734 RepID=A0A8A3S3Q1_9EURY|nr:AAA domain-containing protein [Methanofollis aquaemaris]QSZ66276.1 ATP-dependent helicase [Methanofollis aquaemaris]